MADDSRSAGRISKSDREAGDTAGGSGSNLGTSGEGRAAEAGAANGRQGNHANGRTGNGPAVPVAAPDLRKLLAHGASKKPITVTVDHGFATEYPALWACMTANLTLDDKPRAQPDLRVTVSGSVWVITLTMPEEEKVMEAEAMEPSELFRALERKLGMENPPFRRAAAYVRKRQLTKGKKDLPN